MTRRCEDELPFPDNVTTPEGKRALEVPPWAKMRLRFPRGDTATFARQAFVNPATGELDSIDPQECGCEAPKGMVPLDLTAWTVTCTLKYTYEDADQHAVAQLDNAALGGVTLTQATAGKILVTVPAIATRAFPDWRTRLLVDLQGKDASGNIRTIGSGTYDVDPDVTSKIQ